MTFDVNKPRKFGHWVELAAHVSKLRLWKFFLNNFPLSRSVSTLKIDIFLLLFILSFIVEFLSFWNHLEGKQNSFTGPLSYQDPEKWATGPEKPPGPSVLGQKILNEKHCPLLWPKMSDSREYKWKQMPRFSMKCEFPVLTRKQKGKVLIVESLLWLFRARQSIA